MSSAPSERPPAPPSAKPGENPAARPPDLRERPTRINRFERRRGLVLLLALVISTLGLVLGVDACSQLLQQNALRLRHVPPLAHAARRIHQGWLRVIVQFVPECTRYDTDLFYTLRPGRCVVQDREFTATYEANSMGLRDTEDALTSPEMIVLGDSHVMGWGVSRESAFPSRIAQALGVRVLNAGVPSYGTAREVLLLDRLDRSALKTLVFAYSQNDDDENFAFLKNDFRLPVSSPERYQEALEINRSRPLVPPWPFYATRFPYFVGDYYVQKAKRLYADQRERPVAEREAGAFVSILTQARWKFGDADILVLEINSNNDNDRYFIEAVETLRHQPGLESLFARLRTLDTSRVLEDADYYLLDGHMADSGHEKVAGLIADALPAR